MPDRGDLVWLTFDPQSGHEQRGRRPALVLSPRAYNGRSKLALMCPITSQAKGYPFEVSVQADEIEGVILADHVKSLDWSERHARFIGHVPSAVLIDVLERLRPLLGL